MKNKENRLKFLLNEITDLNMYINIKTHATQRHIKD